MVSLKKYVDTRFTALEKSTETTAFQLDKRLDSMNEFREQLNTQTATFISRPEHEALVQRVNTSENKIANFEGRSYAIGIAFSIITIGISIGLHFLK